MTGFLILIVAAFGAGSLLLRRLALHFDVEGVALRMLAGLGFCGLLGIALGSRSVAMAFGCLLLIALATLAYEVFFARERWRMAIEDSGAGEPLSGFERICALVIMVSLGLAVMAASAPATSWDAAVAHLALPRDYVRDGRIYAMEGNAYSAYPHLAHALFTLAFYRGGEWSAMLTSWMFAALSCALVYAMGKRIADRAAGLCAAAILATAPIFVDLAGTAAIDFVFVAFTLGAWLCLLHWNRSTGTIWLATAALLAGSSIGVRHTGAIVCALLLTGVAVAARHRRMTNTALFALIAAAWATPWLLRSWLVSGNPVYPFLADYFDSTIIPDFNNTGMAAHESTRNIGVIAFLRFPWDLIMKPMQFDGWMKSAGPWVLFLGVPGLFLMGRRGLAIGAYCIVGGVVLFFFRQYARYYLPFLVPMMVLAAAAVFRLGPLRTPVQIFVAVSFVFGLALHLGAVHFKIPAAFGYISRDEYLASRVERYPAFQWVNSTVRSRQGVLTQDIRTYYIDAPSHQNYLALAAIKHLSIARQMQWFEERNLRYWVYCDAYVRETPAFSNYGLLPMFQVWRSDSRYFKLLNRLELPRPNSNETEIVEVYEIRYEADGIYRHLKEQTDR